MLFTVVWIGLSMISSGERTNEKEHKIHVRRGQLVRCIVTGQDTQAVCTFLLEFVMSNRNTSNCEQDDACLS